METKFKIEPIAPFMVIVLCIGMFILTIYTITKQLITGD